MFYKTNEEQICITTDEFINEWKDKQDYLLVDIRENNEVEEQGAIKNAFRISMYDIPDQIDIAPTYIVCLLFCSDGTRAEQVVKYLKNNNLNNMFFIEGGYQSLTNSCPDLRL